MEEIFSSLVVAQIVEGLQVCEWHDGANQQCAEGELLTAHEWAVEDVASV